LSGCALRRYHEQREGNGGCDQCLEDRISQLLVQWLHFAHLFEVIRARRHQFTATLTTIESVAAEAFVVGVAVIVTEPLAAGVGVIGGGIVTPG
jgi:hypothetical protein